jgi:2-dehydro-3-deoxyphosphogluconate aldolase/(4S)-4-hydroxy-2-oxoglutarate aldolase
MQFDELMAQYHVSKTSQTHKAILPVIVIEDLQDAVPLAKALLDGGITMLEVTLRTDVALEAIAAIKSALPEACIGAGTVTSERQFEDCLDAGAEFIISPGITPTLARYASDSPVPFVPGVASASDIMLAIEHDIHQVKFFPAGQAGGIPMLKALSAPFPSIRFCPTGGVNQQNFQEYLALDSVMAVGGSWICPNTLIKEKQWQAITDLC